MKTNVKSSQYFTLEREKEKEHLLLIPGDTMGLGFVSHEPQHTTSHLGKPAIQGFPKIRSSCYNAY